MALGSFSLLGYFSNSTILQFSRRNKVNVVCRSYISSIKLNPVCLSHSAICNLHYELQDEEGEEPTAKNGIDFLYLMEERNVRPDRNTFIWLLEGCVNSRSLSDARMLHGKIIKYGFDDDHLLGNQLMNVYLGLDNLPDAMKLFESMPDREIKNCNNLNLRLLSKKLNWNVIKFSLQMIKDDLELDGVAFSNILRACNGIGIPFHFIEQIHSKIFRHGFSCDPVVGNPLIDLYSKNGIMKSAKLVFDELCSKDSTSWVAMMSCFSQNGLGNHAIYLFYEMQKSGIIPTPYIFSCILSACTKVESFDLGIQIHGQVFKWGYWSRTFVSNALISLYSRHGNLIDAEQIFYGMKSSRDEITYNSLISGYSQLGKSDKALDFFKEMQFSGLKPDIVTIASVLNACASVGSLERGIQLHSYIIKMGISSDAIIDGSLLDLYVKCADIEAAHKFFNSTTKENVVLWNVMLVAYGLMGDLQSSFEIFSQMQIEGLQPNQYTYPSILRTCTSLGAIDLGEQIHVQVLKNGLEHNVYVCSVLIDMYAKCGRLTTARKILNKLIEKDLISWTAMIAGYAQHDCCVEALQLFEEMQRNGIRPDNIGLSSALSACAGIQAFEQGSQIHAQALVLGYSMDLSICNSLVSLYARCGKLSEAYSAFDLIESKDEISWNGLISGFAQSGHGEEALMVFARMNHMGIKANMFTFSSAISASANLAAIKEGMQIHCVMVKFGFDSEIEAGNVLITLYAKCGCIGDAKREFYDMKQRNEVSWNAIITGYAQHGFGHESLLMFEEMKNQGFNPSHVTFLGVLSACSHVGLVTPGINYFNSMNKQHGIVPKPEHYACVVDILGRAGQLDRATKFIRDMTIKPDAMIWRTLLSASAVHRNVEIGEFAAKQLLEIEPHDSANYVLLSNIYAVTGQWDSRDKVRQIMKNNGVKKEPGRSWIEIKNSVHAFFVGDKLHPQSDEIYKYLEELNRRCTDVGYVQNRYSLLHDNEHEKKDPTIYVHSEKLAVTFGMISSSSDIPIRVIKNLRICNDCHTWMKYVSKIASRQIILRDMYRFHHFTDGTCSCKDYW